MLQLGIRRNPELTDSQMQYPCLNPTQQPPDIPREMPYSLFNRTIRLLTAGDSPPDSLTSS